MYNYKPSLRILRQHRILQNLRNNKDIIITKPDKRNRIVVLDRKLYDNVIQEIISGTSKFRKLNENPTLKRETSLQRILRKLKQKNFFSKNEDGKLYPSGSAPVLSMALLKCTNFLLVIHSLKFVQLFL